MRTTLKRGIGQGAGVSGDGQVAVPLFGPMARYRQVGPPRRSVIKSILRGFGWVVLALVVLGSGIGGGLYLYTHESLAEISQLPTGLKHHIATEIKPITSPSQPAIALVAGYDIRGKTKGANPYAGSNSDTLMLLRADPVNHTLSLLSFPRDLWVPIYCHGDVVDTNDRINSAWSLCGNNGPAATLDTIEHLTGLNINYFITLDFHAFKQLVNNLHGVYMNVDRRYYIPLHTGVSAINLQPGYQKLVGGQALSYVRYRHTDSDIYRTGRQQLFIEALKSRLRTSLSLSSLPFEVPKLVHVLKDNIKVVKAGGQAVDLGELTEYLGLIYHLPPGHLFRNSIPVNDLRNVVIGGADVLQTDPSNITTAVHGFLNPDVRDAQAVNVSLGGRPTTTHKKKSKVRKLPRSQISVLVLNAGRATGRASNTSYLLSQRGYTTKTLSAGKANAPRKHSDTIIYYDFTQPDAQQAAQQLKPLFGPHTVVTQMTSPIQNIAAGAGNPLTVVAIGTSFPGTLVVHHRPKVQPKQPPQVSDGAGLTTPRLRQVYDRVHFPLMVPHKIAQGATLSSSEGVRGFKPLKNQHEVAMTFVMPDQIEYWQIEESTWGSAPILQNPSFTLTHRGRKYAVYTTGGQIQMVALRTPQATYWVSNTILNELSNSTMLAIAESLRPLRR